MKQTKKEIRYKRIKERTPTFYKKCYNCEDKIKKETMWYLISGWVAYSGSMYKNRYFICKECALTKDDAYEIFNQIRGHYANTWNER